MLHIVGVVGLPARYGGFETLVDRLIESKEIVSKGVVVYCEEAVARESGYIYKGAVLRPIGWRANGWQSVIYDSYAMILSSFRGGAVLILGTSATLMLPLLRLLFPRVRYYVNMGGIEWKRAKWGGVAKLVLKINEWAAARFAHVLIADNEGLVEYIRHQYGVHADYIPYGGDQLSGKDVDDRVFSDWSIPFDEFDMALSRAQVDNNLELILDAYVRTGRKLVFISNWESTAYGHDLKARYGKHTNLYLVGPIYEATQVKAIRARARLYIHGHSAGGTNPTLVDAMWMGLPMFVFDVSFNRHTTENNARYFSNVSDLVTLLENYDQAWATNCKLALQEVAARKFTWRAVRSRYCEIVQKASTTPTVLVIGGGKMGLSHLAILSKLLSREDMALCEQSYLIRYGYRQFKFCTYANLNLALNSGNKWVAAVVATPTMSHYSIVKSLLEQSIPCFVEKPLTLSDTKSTALLEIQKTTGTFAQLGFVMRFVAAFVKFRSIVKSNILGVPLSYKAEMKGNVITKADNNGWRTIFAEGGGCLNEYGPHLIDLCRHFFGNVKQIESSSVQRTFSTAADDAVDIAWVHSSGCVGQLSLDWCDASKRKSLISFEVKFERGIVVANNADVSVEVDIGVVLPPDQHALLFAPVLPHPVSYYLRGEEYTLQLEVFLERVLSRKIGVGDALPAETAASLADGLEVDKLINEIALKTGLA